jgi:hemerythrin superfamily protein
MRAERAVAVVPLRRPERQAREGLADGSGDVRQLFATEPAAARGLRLAVARNMKATSLLKQQHRKVESLLEQLEKGSARPAALDELAKDLASHMAIEQNIFYPAVRESDPELIEESYEEHAVAELALKRLLGTSHRDPTFSAKVAALKAVVLHHMQQEEEQLFPRVDKALGDKLGALGEKLEHAFRAAQQEGFQALVPSTFARTSADEARAVLGSAEPVTRPAQRHNGRSPSPR